MKKSLIKTLLALGVLATSVTISKSDAYAGGVMEWGDIITDSYVETYYMTLDQASKVTFVNNKAYDSAGNISIKDVKKEQIASTPYEWGNGARFEIYLEPGDYEVEVGLNVNATASVETVPETVKESYTDRNDEKGTATKMALNKVYSGVRGVNDEVDYYAFTLKETSNINVIFNSPTEYDGVNLLNKKGEYIYSCKAGIGTHNDAYVLPAGTYFLEMRDTSYIGQQLGYLYTLQVKSKAVKQPSFKALSNKVATTLTLTAKKQSGAVKYEFQVAKDKKFKKIICKTASKRNTVTMKKLTSGRKVYVRVRVQYLQKIRDDVRPEIPVCKKPVASYSKWSTVVKIGVK